MISGDDAERPLGDTVAFFSAVFFSEAVFSAAFFSAAFFSAAFLSATNAALRADPANSSGQDGDMAFGVTAASLSAGLFSTM
jgi:hypothetical protein